MWDIALVAVFAALIGAFSLTPAINIPWSPVPITLQTLAIALTAMIIGPWLGFLATMLYLVLGFVGLPVFAGGASGISVLAKASAGYLIGFPIYAFVVGLLTVLFLKKGLKWAIPTLVVAGLIGSIVIIHPMGIAGMHFNLNVSWATAAKLDLPFWPGDIVKTVLAALVATAVHKAFPAMLVGKRATAVTAN